MAVLCGSHAVFLNLQRERKIDQKDSIILPPPFRFLRLLSSTVRFLLPSVAIHSFIVMMATVSFFASWPK